MQGSGGAREGGDGQRQPGDSPHNLMLADGDPGAVVSGIAYEGNAFQDE